MMKIRHFLLGIGIPITSVVTSTASPVRAVFVGGDFYVPSSAKIEAAKASGFNTLLLFTLHFRANGDVYYNDTLIVENGVYVGDPNWGASLAALRPTINRIEMSIASWGDPSFSYIKDLIDAEGTGPDSIIYKNFLALKDATGVDAILYDDEQTYDVASAVELGNMIAGMGMKVTLCPYTAQSFWTSVKSQLGDKVDAVYLQCYDGGAFNNPATWNAAFGGFKVYPGLWGNTSTPPTVTSRMRNWQQSLGIEGGFMWLNGGLPNDGAKWAQALAYGLEPLNGLVAADFGVNYLGVGFTGNQGFGYGSWVTSTEGGGSYISGDAEPRFAIWNSAANGTSSAVRPLDSPLEEGQCLMVRLQMTNLDSPANTNRFELRDEADHILFSYCHQGGDNADGHYIDAGGTHSAPGFAYHYQQLDSFQFTLDSPTTFTFTDLTTGSSVNGVLSGAPVSKVAFVRANGAVAPGNGQDFKFNGLVVYTPTALSSGIEKAPAGWTVNFSATPCLDYRIQRSSDLDGDWTDIGTVFSSLNQSSFTDISGPRDGAFYRVATP
ncbi:hypothetical protein [Haloferula sargassicola]|uniref:Uncharacterized protein n=1 Tax=Haloferula sargassicola TaxID=490096 RepID=A0ABP9UJK6_9BACT